MNRLIRNPFYTTILILCPLFTNAQIYDTLENKTEEKLGYFETAAEKIHSPTNNKKTKIDIYENNLTINKYGSIHWKFLIFDINLNLVNYGLTDRETVYVKDIESGDYFLVIEDDKNCTDSISFSIEHSNYDLNEKSSGVDTTMKMILVNDNGSYYFLFNGFTNFDELSVTIYSMTGTILEDVRVDSDSHKIQLNFPAKNTAYIVRTNYYGRKKNYTLVPY